MILVTLSGCQKIQSWIITSPLLCQKMEVERPLMRFLRLLSSHFRRVSFFCISCLEKNLKGKMEFSDSWYNFSICWSPAGLGLSKNCFIWSPADCPSWELMFLEQFSNTAPNGKSAALLQPQLSSGMCGGEPTSDTWSRQGRKLKFSIVFLSPQCLTFWGLFHLDWILSLFSWPKRTHLLGYFKLIFELRF